MFCYMKKKTAVCAFPPAFFPAMPSFLKSVPQERYASGTGPAVPLELGAVGTTDSSISKPII
jgi:hypothetical protein